MAYRYKNKVSRLRFLGNIHIGVVAITLSLLMTACQHKSEHVSLEAEVVNAEGNEGLQIQWNNHNKINGLMKIYFWDMEYNRILWVVDCRRHLFDHIVYGQSPDGAVQIYPARTESPLVGIMHVGIEIVYQYDEQFPPAAAIGSMYFEVEIKDGDAVVHSHMFLNRPQFP